MSELQLIQHDSHLEVVASGDFDLNDTNIYINRILSACQFAGVDCVLIDYRGVEGITHATTRTLIALLMEEEYANHEETSRPVRIACLGLPNAFSNQSGSKIFQAAGLPFASFTDSDNAKSWLGVDGSW